MSARLSHHDRAKFAEAQATAPCITCRRPIDNVTRAQFERSDVYALPDDDFCRWCGRGITERAREVEQAIARPRQPELVVNVDTRGVAAR